MNARTLAVCGIMLAIVAGCNKTGESYDKKFKESFHDSFVMSCTASSVKNGMKESYANNTCKCVAGYLISKYSVDDLKKLANTELSENKAILGEARNSCQ